MPEAPSETCAGPKSSYGQILRSTALIGSSSAATIVINVVRTKAIAIAVLLGPAVSG